MANNLKALRKANRMSLEELGDAVNSSKSYMWELEREKSNPSLQLAYKVARVLDVSVYDIWPDETEVVEEIIIVRRAIKKESPPLVYATTSG